jgi:hypothetical protein
MLVALVDPGTVGDGQRLFSPWCMGLSLRGSSEHPDAAEERVVARLI